MDLIAQSLRTFLGTAVAVLPIIAFMLGFQVFVIRQRLPNLRRLFTGLAFAIVGLALFLIGLNEALFPLGRLMAEQLTSPAFIAESTQMAFGSLADGYVWVYLFALAIGFSTAIAEPALLAVAMKANDTSGGAISVWGLRVAVAAGASIGVGLGCYRIVAGLPLHAFIIAGYIIVVLQTVFAPKRIVPLAYDSGGVTTSTVTVPLVTALGLGLAEAVPGRSPLLDGFGLVAFTALFPIISVLGYAQLSVLRDRIAARRRRHSAGLASMEEN